jgi:hypothetical protein
MAQIYDDWSKNSIVPRGGLYAWNSYRASDATGGNVPDLSGQGHPLTAASNTPVLTSDILNGQPAWVFNGSRNPLAAAGSVSLKHIFVLAAFSASTFSGFQGLLTGAAVGSPLISNSSGTKFFDSSGTYLGQVYRKGEVVFANSNMQAPVASVPAVIELTAGSVDFGFDAIQVGKDRADGTRLFTGNWFDQLLYTSVKTDAERQRIYEYFAMRYWVWSKDSTNTYDVFPFAHNRTRSEEFDQESYLSEPYSGDPKELVRGNYRGGYSLPFLLREQAELDAAKQFIKLHGKSSPFVIRDYRYYPYRELIVRRTSSLREQGSDTSYRFNYSFDVIEV